MYKKNENDDGLYDLIDVTDNSSNDSTETCRTDNLMFNNNRVDWDRIKINGNCEKSSLSLNNGNTGEINTLKLMDNNSSTISEINNLSQRSKLINKRAEVNMGIYLPLNLRGDVFQSGANIEYVLCRECGERNTKKVGWCLFCGLLLIGEKENEEKSVYNCEINDESIDFVNSRIKWRQMDVEEIDEGDCLKNVKLDLEGIRESIGLEFSGGGDWDFDINGDDDGGGVAVISDNIVSRGALVPPLDFSCLDSSRDRYNINNIVEESKENKGKDGRKWPSSSSSAWIDIPESILQKKPSSYYRNKLNSCTNKMGVTVLKSGINKKDYDDEVAQIISSKSLDDDNIIKSNQYTANYIDFKEQSSHISIYRPPIVIDIDDDHCNDLSVSRWQCLPAEIWIEIMTYLSHGQLSCLQQTCRRIYSIGLHSSLWKVINLYKHLNITNDDIFYIARKKPKELHFNNCYGTNIDPDRLEAMFKDCGEGLKKISFISCSKGAFEDDLFLILSANSCPNVTHINASYLMNFRDETLQKMIKGFIKIESLKIMGSHSISNKSIKYLIELHRSSLINLDLYGCFKLNSLTLTLLENCLNLKSLALGSITNLKRLTLISMLKKLSQLTTLDLRGTMNLVDDSLLQQISQSCPKLEQIILTNSCRLTDEGVIGLARSCVSKSLKILDICGCSKITEKGLEEVLKQCRELEDLDISCTGIRGEGSRFFKIYSPPKLRCLRINNNKFISIDELKSLMGSCKRLNTLYMCGTTSIRSWRCIEETFPHVTFKHE